VPGDEGITWGTIVTAISEDDETDSFDWTVDAPDGGDYYLYGVIDDAVATDEDYTSSTVHVNVPAEIDLDDPAPGAEVNPGDVYAITWTDSDPDDDAQIGLYWDSDTDSANNVPGEEGVNWGTITTGISEGDETDSYDWAVDAPGGGDYYLYGVIGDGLATDEDYTATALHVNAPPEIDLNDPAPGAEVNAGDVYTITWTDRGMSIRSPGQTVTLMMTHR